MLLTPLVFNSSACGAYAPGHASLAASAAVALKHAFFHSRHTMARQIESNCQIVLSFRVMDRSAVTVWISALWCGHMGSGVGIGLTGAAVHTVQKHLHKLKPFELECLKIYFIVPSVWHVGKCYSCRMCYQQCREP